MEYNFKQAIEILERTPDVLNTLLNGLSEEWIMNNEGTDSFSPYDVVGHMLHGENADWTERIKRIFNFSVRLCLYSFLVFMISYFKLFIHFFKSLLFII